MTDEHQPAKEFLPSVDQLDRYLAGAHETFEAQHVEAWLRATPRAAEVIAAFLAHASGSDDASVPETREILAPVQARVAAMPVATSIATPTTALAAGAPRESVAWHSSVRKLYGLGIGVALGALVVGALVWSRWSPISKQAIVQYSTTKGERASVQLIDGTRVLLGPESILRVDAMSSDGPRKVTLAGNAYFDIDHNSKSPFTVHAGDVIVRELGTAFGVTHYPNDGTVAVVVAQGKVNVSTATRMADGRTASATLVRGDAASVFPAGVIRIEHDVDLAARLGWVNGQLSFRRATVFDVARGISLWYNVDIVIPDSAVGMRRVTASFAGESVEAVLTQLTDVIDAGYVRHGRSFTITGKE